MMDLLEQLSECVKVMRAGVDGESDLPSILLGIVVAYLTILISVAIAIFSEKEKEFETLDRNVILDHIIKAKSLLVYLGFTFVPLLFWNNSLPWTRLIAIIIWAIGLGFLIAISVHSYHWMKGNKYRLRFDYLKRLHNTVDTEDAWRSVWQADKINYQNEQEFFTIYSSTCKRFMESESKDDLVMVSKLLGDFNNRLSNRSSIFLLRLDGMYGTILEWHFYIWKKEQANLSKEDKLNEWALYGDLSRTLDSIFRHIETRALKEKEAFLFFRKLEKHASKYKMEVVSSRYYVENVLDIFYRVFFEQINEAPERFAIWEHYYPKDWQVTYSNLRKTDNILSRISLNNFYQWAQPRIWQRSKELDYALNDVASNLFPEVDPISWSRILIFALSSYGEDRLQSMIESPWNFGFMGRIRVYSVDQEEEMETMYASDRISTFKLAYLLFKKVYSPINLERYINDLNNISYPDKPKEESKRTELISLFTEMLTYVRSEEKAEAASSETDTSNEN
jgi:hypothetical protein